jgi:hypothetical protein
MGWHASMAAFSNPIRSSPRSKAALFSEDLLEVNCFAVIVNSSWFRFCGNLICIVLRRKALPDDRRLLRQGTRDGKQCSVERYVGHIRDELASGEKRQIEETD